MGQHTEVGKAWCAGRKQTAPQPGGPFAGVPKHKQDSNLGAVSRTS